jgi:hypothetical protein
MAALGDVTIDWADPSTNDDQSGIVAVHRSTRSKIATLD